MTEPTPRTTPPTAKLRLALLGSGVFVRQSYVPALEALADTIQVATVFSRDIERVSAILPG